MASSQTQVQEGTVEVSVLPPPQRAVAPRVFGALSLLFALPSLAMVTCLPMADVWTLTYGGLKLETRRVGGERKTRVRIVESKLHVVHRRGLRETRAARPRAQRAEKPKRRYHRHIDLAVRDLAPKARAHANDVFRIGQGIVISFLAFGLLLLFTGVGQLRGRRWGRWLSILWGLTALLYTMGMLFFLVPEYAKSCRALAEALLGNYIAANRVCPPYDLKLGGLIGMALGTYPLLMLGYFSSNVARRAMP